MMESPKTSVWHCIFKVGSNHTFCTNKPQLRVFAYNLRRTIGYSMYYWNTMYIVIWGHTRVSLPHPFFLPYLGKNAWDLRFKVFLVFLIASLISVLTFSSMLSRDKNNFFSLRNNWLNFLFEHFSDPTA